MARSTDESFELQIAKDLVETVPRIMRRIRAEMRTMAKPQLTIAQLRVLAKLYQGSSSITDLAEWMGVSAPAMSKMVSIVEARGLVQRNAQSQDRRLVEVKLTDEGRKIFLSIRKAVRVKIAEDLMPLPDAKKQLIYDALQTLSEIYG